MIIEGKHIDLHEMSPDDAALTLKWRMSERAKYLNKGSIDVSQQREWIKNRPSNEYNFIISLKNSQSIGTISLVNINRLNLTAEPGRFLIGEESLCRGIPVAAEALLMIYELAFCNIGLNRIYGTISSTNKLMIKFHKYTGLTVEGVLRSHLVQDGCFVDAVCIGLLKEEYQKNTKQKLLTLIG